MSGTRSLPILMPAVEDQKWSCHSCGDCCRTLVGHLFDEERERIEQQGWREKLGLEPCVRVGRGWVLNKHADGACVFLDENNRCRIHSEFGEEAKPLACRIFPFSLRRVPAGWQASLRFDCPSVIRSQGRPIRKHRDGLVPIAARLEETSQPPSTRDVSIDLVHRRAASHEEIEALEVRLRRWLRNDQYPVLSRLLGATRLTTTLHAVKLRNVRGDRFIELLDLLFAALPAECETIAEPPTPRQRGMLRQLAFAHAEHVDLTLLRANVFHRFGRRISQLRAALRFRTGKGMVPDLPGFPSGVPFDAVESVQVAGESKAEVENLLQRYLTARLEGRSVYGEGYYGKTVVYGLAALWMSIAAAGWLARLLAAGRGERVQFGDVGVALGVVDRAATRLPALGTVAERARLSYLLQHDGLARLLHAYSLS